MTLYRWGFVSLILGAGLSSCAKQSESHARIAVATNFLPTAQKLETVFEAETDYTIDFVSGSTGQLYTQIINGAPYEAFLSADASRITRLLVSGYGVEGTRLTYAKGQLVLYGAGDVESALTMGKFKKLAMANPDLAPYGRAAKEVLEHMQLSQTSVDKIIYGQNIGQAYGFVKTGNADLGFVALSQIQNTSDNYWRVPKDHYDTIWQDSILLSKGQNNKSAMAFLTYLKSPEAQTIIRQSGYEVGRQ